MLNPMDRHNLGIGIDVVDDSIVTTASREETGKLTDKRLAQFLRVLADRSVQSDERGITDLLGKLV